MAAAGNGDGGAGWLGQLGCGLLDWKECTHGKSKGSLGAKPYLLVVGLHAESGQKIKKKGRENYMFRQNSKHQSIGFKQPKTVLQHECNNKPL
jgi:hypothetical protein